MKQKIKIMKNRQRPSDDEIQSYMNFEHLLTNLKQTPRPSHTVAILKWTVPALIITGTIGWFLLFNGRTPASHQLANIERQDSASSSDLGPAVVNIDSAADQRENFPNETTKMELPAPHATEPEQTNKAKSVDDVKESVYIQAEPIHGYAELYNYFNLNLQYPAEAIKDSIQGIQTISFIINSGGKPEKIQIVRSLGEPFERESRRLIENMPEWKPATLNGKPIASKITIPLTFQIKKIKTY